MQPSLTHAALKDMWVRVSITLEEFAFSLLVVFLDSLFSQINDGMDINPVVRTTRLCICNIGFKPHRTAYSYP